MLIIKQGLPSDSEILLCTVTKIYPHCVFVTLDEYENKSGMIHISEISPGRIRNINDYVKQGKKIVCKVLRIDKIKGHIDLSLRRVSEGQRREKMSEIKQEQLAEKIIELIAKETKQDVKKLYTQIFEQINKEYDGVYPFFEDVVEDEKLFNKIKLPKEVGTKLLELIQLRIKPQQVTVKGVLTLSSPNANGVEDIKNALIKGESSSEKASIAYLGAGKYSITIIDDEYKSAEAALRAVSEAAVQHMESVNGMGSFARIEAK